MSEDAPDVIPQDETVDAAMQAGLAAGMEAAGMTPEEAAITAGRVQDPAKAEHMAYASQGSEETAKFYQREARHWDKLLASVDEDFPPGNISEDKRDLQRRYKAHRDEDQESADAWQAQADKKADAAANEYDQLKNL